MSFFQSTDVPCPACGVEVAFRLSHSVNADRRPDLRQEILDGTFQRETCGRCGARFRVDPELSYLDMKRGQWIYARALSHRVDWQRSEATARRVFDESYGAGAGRAASELGGGLRPRVTFGWAGFREKLLSGVLGLDDVEIELCKLAVIRGVEQAPFSDQTELRLIDQVDTRLVFGWLVASEDRLLETVTAPRSLYDEISRDVESWDELRMELSGGLFVDLWRILHAGAL